MIQSFGISNIAWPPEALDQGLDLASALGFSFVEIAPFNVFGRWDKIYDEACRLRDLIECKGLVCNALQGIVYNVSGVELFVSDASRERLTQHLEKVAKISAILGAKTCVYGAPKQRDPGHLTFEEARAIAIRFFRSVGTLFAEQGATLAFEANARSYGCRFVTTTEEAAKLVRAIGTTGIGLQIDTGTIFVEHENPDVFLLAAPLASHAHVSEANLEPTGTTGVDHGSVGAALKNSGYAGSLSIEMRAVKDWRAAMRRATEIVRMNYL
jgi:sugar phosphate isomerase/epimerase